MAGREDLSEKISQKKPPYQGTSLIVDEECAR
jgi:hypothetical protein